MKTIKKAASPLLLLLGCFALWFWQHAVASLPYLPLNGVVPLGVLTPALLVLTFLAAFAMLRQSGTKRPVLRSLLWTGAMLLPILATGVYFLSYLSYRFAAVLPVPVLPDWPTGITTMIIAFVCAAVLTALMIRGLAIRKAEPKLAVPAVIDWLLLNCCLFLITT